MKRLAVMTTLLALPALAHADHFRAELIGYHEVPAVSSQADAVFDARTNNNNAEINYTLSYEGLSSAVQQAHIHFAQKAVNGPIIIWLCGTAALPGPAGTPTCPQSGSVSGTITAASVLASPASQQIAAGELGEMIQAMRAGVAYANVHTAVSPGGEIRGQIFRIGR